MRDPSGRFLPGHDVHPRAIPRTTPSPDRLKECRICGEWVPIDCFNRDPGNPDGHENRCRACRKERRWALDAGAKRAKPWALRRKRGTA